MILHEQNNNIDENITALETHIKNLGYPNHAIHVGSLIRRESVYSNDLMEERKKNGFQLFLTLQENYLFIT